jgi:osmoprotectant transport system ATP-binding protein
MPDERMAPSLAAHAVFHWYGAQQALENVSLTVSAGSVLAIVGESGSGKTTVLRCFNRLVEPRQGRITIDGEAVRDGPAEMLRRRIGYVPQQGGLLPHWSIRRNVALVPMLSGAADAHRTADDALGMVGLDPCRFGDRLPRELSGGQRQRAALARAFAARQRVVLLDEPFGALDAISRSEAHETFERVRRELAFTALLVTHDLAEAARLADRIAVMRNGRVEQEGALAEIQDAPASPYVQELFARAHAAHAALAGAGR